MISIRAAKIFTARAYTLDTEGARYLEGESIRVMFWSVQILIRILKVR